MSPNEFGTGGGEALQEALGDEADLDVAVIGGDFAPDGASVVIAFVMKVLVTIAAPDGVHIHHPEVVGPGAEGVEGLLEGDLDFEAQGVEANNLGRRERQIAGHEDKAAAGGMDDGDEAHKALGGAPEQIARGPPHADTLFAVSGALHGLKWLFEQSAQTQLAAIEPWAAPPSPGIGHNDSLESAGVVFAPGNEVAAPFEEPADDLAAGVIGVGDQEHGLGQVHAGEEDQELIEQGALVAVAEYQSLVNAGAQGDGVVKASDARQ